MDPNPNNEQYWGTPPREENLPETPSIQRQGNQYRSWMPKPPQSFDGEVPLATGNPAQGSDGPNSWGARYDVYGEPTPRGFHIQNQLLKHLHRAAMLANNQFAGFPQWTMVSYGVVTPMQNLRTTGPEGAQASNVGYTGPTGTMADIYASTRNAQAQRK